MRRRIKLWTSKAMAGGAALLLLSLVLMPDGDAQEASVSVAISGLRQPFGLAVHSAGDIFVAEHAGNRVLRVSPDGKRTTLLRVRRPTALVLAEPDRLFVASAEDGTIHSVTLDGGASLLASGFSNPNGLALAPDGGLFVADTAAGTVLEVSPEGRVNPIAEGLPAPIAVAAMPDGGIAVATRHAGVIHLTRAGQRNAQTAPGAYVSGGILAGACGSLFVFDPVHGRIWRRTARGAVRLVSDKAGRPISGAVTQDGSFLVSDWDSSAVLRVANWNAVPKTTLEALEDET